MVFYISHFKPIHSAANAYDRCHLIPQIFNPYLSFSVFLQLKFTKCISAEHGKGLQWRSLQLPSLCDLMTQLNLLIVTKLKFTKISPAILLQLVLVNSILSPPWNEAQAFVGETVDSKTDSSDSEFRFNQGENDNNDGNQKIGRAHV